MNTTINNDCRECSWENTIQVEYNKNEKKGIILFEKIFKFSFRLNDKNTLDYFYTFNPNKADSVSKILFACNICKTFLSGRIKIRDTPLIEYRQTIKNKRDEKSFKYLIKYWNKISELEKLLNSKFSPAEIIKNFDKESFTFSKLERCLLEKKPYRINDLVLKETLTFANQKFELYKIKGLYNVLAKDIQISQKTNVLTPVKILIDHNNDKMYLSEQLFLTKQDANNSFNDENLKQLELATPL